MNSGGPVICSWLPERERNTPRAMARNSRRAREREAQRQRKESREKLEATRRTAARQELAANLHLLQALTKHEQEREKETLQRKDWLSFRMAVFLTSLGLTLLVLTLTRQLVPTLEKLFGEFSHSLPLPQ